MRQATKPRTAPSARTGRSRDSAPAKRNVVRTREKILNAARREFCSHGYNGARIQKIATRAGANIRMLYHYFGSKENLYVNVLESIYIEVRSKEAALDLKHLEPVEAMSALVEFTFMHLMEHPDFISLVTNENLLRGRHIRKSKIIPAFTTPLMETIQDILNRGKRAGMFRHEVDPVQLYVTILSMCYLHLSNKYTLSSMFQMDLGNKDWLEARLAHVQDVVLSFLEHPSSNPGGGPRRD